MTLLIHLLVILAVLAVLVWIARSAPIPQPFVWIAYAVIFIIALIALLPLIGVHLPA